MAEVVLDANVLVALLYQADVHHDRARELTDRLEREGHTVVMLDFWSTRLCQCSVAGRASERRARRISSQC